MATAPIIFSVGHSTHTLDRFVELLKGAGVTAVADVRSVPYTRHTPQFSRPALKDALRRSGIAYSFLGDGLGARPSDRSCYHDGVADYALISGSPAFQDGIGRVLRGASDYTIAVMCAEKEPLDCHRTILVCRELARRGASIRHILADGSIEPHEATEARLLKMTAQERMDDFFDDPLDNAYRIRGAQIAFVEVDEPDGQRVAG